VGGAMLALALGRDLDLGPVVLGADYFAGFAHQVLSETATSLRVPPLGSNPTGQRKLEHKLPARRHSPIAFRASKPAIGDGQFAVQSCGEDSPESSLESSLQSSLESTAESLLESSLHSFFHHSFQGSRHRFVHRSSQSSAHRFSHRLLQSSRQSSR
jgi:hypothetical protein